MLLLMDILSRCSSFCMCGWVIYVQYTHTNTHILVVRMPCELVGWCVSALLCCAVGQKACEPIERGDKKKTRRSEREIGMRVEGLNGKKHMWKKVSISARLPSSINIRMGTRDERMDGPAAGLTTAEIKYEKLSHTHTHIQIKCRNQQTNNQNNNKKKQQKKNWMFYTKWRMCIYKFHLRYTHIQTYEFVTQTLEHWSTYYYVLCAYIIKSTHTYTEKHTRAEDR